jgi:hypothetical protein
MYVCASKLVSISGNTKLDHHQLLSCALSRRRWSSIYVVLVDILGYCGPNVSFRTKWGEVPCTLFSLSHTFHTLIDVSL